jgi:CRISPR-associated exonuclease Cas4
VAPSFEALQLRCKALVPAVVAVARSTAALDPDELAATAWSTFCLPDLAHNRDEIVPEVPVYGSVAADPERLVSGRADAVRYKHGRASIVFDWKSEVAPSDSERVAYRSQVLHYARALGARRAAVVYMSLGQIDWIEAA